MDYITASEFKRKFDLREYVSDLETKMDGGNTFIVCPFHMDSNPSCLINSDKYYCFGCGAHGDSIDFIMKHEDVTFTEVLKNYDRYIKAGKNSTVKPKANSVPAKYSSLPISIAVNYNVSLLDHPDKIKYLERRLVNKDTIERAYIGWGVPANFTNFVKPRYTIPVIKDGKLLTIRYRIDPSHDDGSEPKYLAHPKTDTYLYNAFLLEEYSDVVIVGSEFDAAFLYWRYKIAALSPPGETVFKDSWKPLFAKKNVLIVYDNDVAGYKGAMSTYDIISDVANVAKIYKWPHKYNKKYDVGDLVVEFGIDKFDEILEQYNINAYV